MEEQAESATTDEDFVLRAWDGDESVLAELVVALAPQLEQGMRVKYAISAEDAEDVVCEAFRLFWKNSRSLRWKPKSEGLPLSLR